MPEEKDKDEVSRPMTLYVERVDTKTNIDYINRRRVTVIDVEIPLPQAEQVIEYLRERNQSNHNGAIRLRLVGRLILS